MTTQLLNIKNHIMVRKISLLFIGFLFFSFSSFSQDLDLVWAQQLGGEGADRVKDFQIDEQGDVYVTGIYTDTLNLGGPDNPVEFIAEKQGSQGMYVAKYNSEGQLQWAKDASAIAAWEYCFGEGLVIMEDHLLVLGSFQGSAMAFGQNVGDTIFTNGGPVNMYVAKYSMGGDFQGVLYQNASGGVAGLKILKDQQNQLIIHGVAVGSNCTIGDYNFNSNGSGDMYIASFSEDFDLNWIHVIGGPEWDSAGDIQFDNDGNIVLGATFEGSVLFENNIEVTAIGGEDVLIAKFNSNGEIQWANAAGGDSRDDGKGIGIDSENNIFITGFFTDNITIGDNEPIYGSLKDVFIAKYSPEGTFMWIQTDGGAGHDYSYGITMVDNNPTITGSFAGEALFGSDDNIVTLNSGGNNDVFVASYKNDGSAMNYATNIPGSGDGDEGRLIKSTPNNELFVSGRFTDNLTFGTGTNQTTLIETGEAYTDAFLVKYNVIIIPEVSVQPVDVTICDGNSCDFLVSVEGSNTYQWQVNEGQGFEDVADNGIYSNSTTDNLTITAAVFLMNAYEYKCVISGSNNQYTIESDNAILMVDELIIADAGIDIDLPTVNYTQLNATPPSSGIGTWSVIEGSGTFSDVNQPDCIVTGLEHGTNIFQWKVINGECETVDEVELNYTVGINSLDQFGYSIYPNPTAGLIKIDTKNELLISIFNQQGSLIKSLQITGSVIIDLSRYATGLYMITIRDMNGDVFKEKIILR